MMKPGAGPFRLTALAACAAALACGNGTPTETRNATRIDVLSGGSQTGGVGSPLAGKIVIQTADAQGPIGGVTVTAATEAQGGGSASPSTVTTGTDGTAQITWNLGGKIGAQTLTFSSTGIPSVFVSASATPGAAEAVFAISESVQFTVVSRPVTNVPTVRVTDAFGNPIAGVPVTFEITVPGSVLTGTEQVSDATGLARVGSWTIGPDAISYGARARIASGGTALFEARGIPATITAVAGQGQTANAGTAVLFPPAVRAARDDGTPLPGVTVSFVVAGGIGQILGGTSVTGSDGIARASGWILGAVPGANRVDAVTLGVPPVAFTATAVLGTPATVNPTSPMSQDGFFGNYVGAAPAVVVTDAQSNPVAGTAVIFELVQTDGRLVGATQVTDFMGRALLGGWRLGGSGTQAVRAVVTGFPPITFTATATAPPPSTFNLEVRYPNTPPSPAQREAFDQAAARWKTIILAGTAPYPVNEPADPRCFPAINETVDGLIIFADLKLLDGVGKVLGQAGPCIVRDDAGFLPAVGIMQFDTADLPGLEDTGRLNDVILHEMGHVLGFGTIWNFPDPGDPIIGPNNPRNALLSGAGTSNPVFIGLSTRAAFLGAVAADRTFTGVPVPVENSGGGGTRDSHWREITVVNELMTGFLNNGDNPLSAFTATSFRDLGYVVNDAVTDAFTFQAFLQAAAAPLMSFVSGLQLIEGKLTAPIIVIDRHGRTVARVPRM